MTRGRQAATSLEQKAGREARPFCVVDRAETDRYGVTTVVSVAVSGRSTW